MTIHSDAEDIDLQHVAARLAARSQIRDVRLIRTEASIHTSPDPERSLTYDLELEPAVDADPAISPSFVVRMACHLRIQNSQSDDNATETADSDQTAVATALFEYAGLFDYALRENEDDPTEEEFTAYATTTGRFALYPFIREYVYDLTGRLALPPLTLEVLSRPMPGLPPK